MAKRGPTEGSIYQRKSDGRWTSLVYLGRDGNGKRLRKQVYARTYEEVLEKKRETEERHRRGEPVSFPAQSVGAFLDDWLEALEGSVRARTLDTYSQHVRLHIKPTLGKHKLEDLNQAHIVAWLRKLRSTTTRSGEPLSQRTVRDVYDVLNRSVKQAVDWGLVRRNVVGLVDRPRVDAAEMTCLDRDQVAKLLEAVQGTRYEALYTLAVTWGLRRGELLALTWRDVDLDRGLLIVRRSLSRLRGELVFGEPKTRKSRRSIKLGRNVVSVLKAHKALLVEERRAAGNAWVEHNLVFPSSSGTPLDPRNLGRHLDQTLARAKLPHIRVHDLRHTAASLMIAQKIEAKVISEILGHASVSTTYNIYVHLFQEHFDEAADAMDRLFGAG